MITTRQPESWRELQPLVGEILSECGFAVEIEKVVRSVRGHVEIDVYAEESVKGRKYRVLVECKHWQANVPQTVVHAFRTVISETGANVGYIVASSGFQSGAQAAVDLTNIDLVTWQEFLNRFEDTWWENFFRPQLPNASTSS